MFKERDRIIRFIEKFEISDEPNILIGTPCWVWTGVKSSRGYGGFHVGMLDSGKPKKANAHKWCYETFVGPVPEGLEIDHLCRNRACINPDHLEPVTHKENQRRWGCGKHITENLFQRNKTHCPRGHKYNEENTYRRPDGGRDCRKCMRRRNKEWKLKKLHHGANNEVHKA